MIYFLDLSFFEANLSGGNLYNGYECYKITQIISHNCAHTGYFLYFHKKTNCLL